ncbi:MAG: hypothetical protein COA57_09950 [Flavobacteriales bacterium]|nr:MAG: hypothetical protein COA57_09950 [Flavobacteriales bacterium]
MNFCLVNGQTDTIPIPSNLTPDKIEHHYALTEIFVNKLLGFIDDPKVIIYEAGDYGEKSSSINIAVQKSFNFSHGTDSWKSWTIFSENSLPEINMFFNEELIELDTAQLDNQGNPEIVIRWRHDETYAGGKDGGRHTVGIQVWNIDSAICLLDIVISEYFHQDINDGSEDYKPIYCECDRPIIFKNGLLYIEKPSCDKKCEVNNFTKGVYKLSGNFWTKIKN